MESHHDVCVALDKLTIDMLSLMEQNVQNQMNIENITKNGSIHLAKSRYIMGHQTVSSVQLPTENTPDFSALSTVNVKSTKCDNSVVDQFELDFKKKDADGEYVNPINWFGILVPQNLYQAQNSFKKGIEYVIETLNQRKQLESICDAISELKVTKNKLKPEE